jgi:lambda repressor-like predicted transcriptional regulator
MYSLELSAQVSALMVQRGLSYRALAAASGISQPTMWNRLHAGGFKPKELWLVAAVLDTSVVQLVTDAARAAVKVATL